MQETCPICGMTVDDMAAHMKEMHPEKVQEDMSHDYDEGDHEHHDHKDDDHQH